MAGRPQGTAARTQVLQVRLTPAGMSTLDDLRGTRSRADFIRDLLTDAARKRA